MNTSNRVSAQWVQIKVWCLRILFRGIALLPLPVLQIFGQSLGSLNWIFQSRMAKVSAENIMLCFPDLNRNQQIHLTKWSLQETGKTLMESAFAWASTPDQCLKSIKSVEGKELVDRLKSEGRGLIFIIPHLGNWEIINHYLGKHYGLTHMYLPNKSAALESYIQAKRSQTGTNFVKANKRGIKAQLKILKDGGAIGAMPDQEPDVHTGIFTRFFRQDALTSELVPGLVDRTGAHCVLAYCKRRQDSDGFDIILDQIELKKEELPEEVHCNTAQQINNAIELAIRQAPEQYLWSYKRFRTRQAGAPELYQFQDSQIRSSFEKLLIRLFLRLTSSLDEQTIRSMAKPLTSVLLWTRSRRARTTDRNLKLCFPSSPPEEIETLKRSSLVALMETALETGNVWFCNNQHFEQLLVSEIGKEHLREGATIVLTPPLGNRELVLRYLGQHFHTVEYYHPNTRRSLNELIIRQRTAMGIALVPHTKKGLDSMVEKLNAGGIISICPDQQPRIRGGEFVSFFGVDALTTSVIPQLLKEHHAGFVFGVAIRQPGGFRLHFEPCRLDAQMPAKEILSSLNKQMEAIIQTDPAQYRWSDKRFNIRPPGEQKLY